MRFVNPWRSWVDGLSSKLAFFPPPPTYSVLQKQDKLVLESSTDPLTFEHIVKKVRTRPTRRGGYGADETTVVAVFIPFTRGTRTDRCTILCSHGNAVDLGQMLPIYKELSQLLRVNIMAYDFSGYGCSTGVATANQTLADIQAVFDCLVEECGVPVNRIVLYGQSVGSGPTSWLGAQEQALAGVVLHSPLLSGVRVLHPNISWWPSWADVFPNQVHVPHIKAPVLIMHGTEDEVIHISCGQRLAKLVKHPWPHLWAEGYNHQNLEACPEYLPAMARFIAHVSKL